MNKKLLPFYKYKNWYFETNKLLRQLYLFDADFIAALIASTSPRFPVSRNIKTALRIFESYEHINKYDLLSDMKAFNKHYKVMTPHYHNIKRTFETGNGEKLQGLKVKSFYENLTGNYNTVTVDIWMYRYYNILESERNNKNYKKVSGKVIKESKQNNLLPAELQAIIWTFQRYINNYKPASFVPYLKYNQLSLNL